MTDEPKRFIDLDIAGSQIKVICTIDEAKALLVYLQDVIGAAESEDEHDALLATQET